MTFANLSFVSVAAGIVGLAAVLYVLQRLRVRYREVSVVTTLFWRQAVEQSPVRVFRKQFRHILAYLLILAICSLIWISFADPRLENQSAGQEHYVLLLDGSAGMSRADKFERAVAALKKDVALFPDNAREVFWVGGTVRKLLGTGEHQLLLDERLQLLEPQAAPPAMEGQILQLATLSRQDRPVTVLIYGDSPIRQQILDSMPPGIKIVRAGATEVGVGNTGITSLGIGESISGVWDTIDLLVTVQSDTEETITRDDFEIRIDGQTLELAEIDQRPPGTFVLRDLPAKGGLLQVQLVRDDVLALDNVARLRLPDRSPIKVMLSPSLVSVLGDLLAVDPAVKLTDQYPDVIVRRYGESTGTDPSSVSKPVLEFVPMASQNVAFLLTYSDKQQAPPNLAAVMQSVGLNQIDARTLAEAANKPIEVSVTAGTVSNFSVWEELIGGEYNFVQSRSFPLFIAKSLRWLSGAKAWHPYVAAGQPLIAATDGRAVVLADQQGNALETLGAPFVPPSAGVLLDTSGLDTGDGLVVPVSLLDAMVTLGTMGASLDVADTSLVAGLRSQSLVTWLLLLALLLLAVEWFFFQKGLLP